MRRWIPVFLSVLAIFVLTFLVYANSFGNEFVFDDISQIITNPVIRSFSGISDAFTHHLTYFSEKHRLEGKFYRPLQTVTLMVDYFLWGKEPLGYHITNTLLHALVGILLFLFLRLVTRNAGLSFLVSAVYAVHPAHTEAVAYMSGRADALSTIFLLLAMIFQRRYWEADNAGRKALYYLLILASFVIALFCKESAVMFPFMLMLCDYCLRCERSERSERSAQGYSSIINKRILFYLPFFFIMIAWFLAKNTIVTTETMVFKPSPLGVRIISVPRNIVGYLRLSIIPTDLHMEYRLPYPHSPFQRGYFGPIVFIVFFLAAFYYVWQRGKRDPGYRILFFGLAWFLLGLLPYLSIFFQLNAPFAEHWLYVPEMGLLLGIFYALYYRARTHRWATRALAAACVVMIVVFSVLTVRQNAVWKDPVSFYLYTLKYAPYSATIYNNLAIECIKAQDFSKAEVYFKKALEIQPDYETAIVNLRQLEEDKRKLGMP